MIVVRSVGGIPLRLTRERWRHIVVRHPEMLDERARIFETLEKPDMIQEGDFGAKMALKFYSKTPLTSKHLCVVYKEEGEDGFVLTAYFTPEPSPRRKILWKP